MSGDNFRRENFLRVLRGEGGRPTLFEPFICDELAEQLIWRRGRHLWNEPLRYLETVISLRERTGSDVVCVDTRRFCRAERRRLLDGLPNFDADFVVITDDDDEAALCDSIDSVAAVAGFGEAGKHTLPFIRMDGDIESAIREKADGLFLSDGIFDLYGKSGAELTLLGGLDAERLRSSKPADIYALCEKIMTETSNVRYALGSGGVIGEDGYLSLISLLGIYRRYR